MSSQGDREVLYVGTLYTTQRVKVIRQHSNTSLLEVEGLIRESSHSSSSITDPSSTTNTHGETILSSLKLLSPNDNTFLGFDVKMVGQLPENKSFGKQARERRTEVSN